VANNNPGPWLISKLSARTVGTINKPTIIAAPTSPKATKMDDFARFSFFRI